MLSRIKRLWKRARHRVGVFRDYAPLLWEDEDWDYYHLVALLELKLRRMEKRLFGPEGKANWESSETDVKAKTALITASAVARDILEIENAEFLAKPSRYKDLGEALKLAWNWYD